MTPKTRSLTLDEVRVLAKQHLVMAKSIYKDVFNGSYDEQTFDMERNIIAIAGLIVKIELAEEMDDVEKTLNDFKNRMIFK